MRYSGDSPKDHNAQGRAAVFVDYENLFSHLYGRSGSRMRPEEIISDLLQAFKRYLLDEFRAATAMTAAYADFSEMHGGGQHIQRGLYLLGIEPRFVPGSMQRNAAEIQLCVDAVEALHTRSDVRTIAIVTGERPYLPLVQHCQRSGARAVIATFRPPGKTGQRLNVADDVFVDALTLLSEDSRRALSSAKSAQRSSAAAPKATRTATRPHPVEYREITHQGALHALEVIDEHFGQYEEIYLTPLLRKLSEVLDDIEYDPKSLISEIESAGAVWLEKRRGFPYDYTVLLIDIEHPNVVSIQKRGYADSEADTSGYAPQDARFEEEYAESDTYEEGEAYADTEYDSEYTDAYEEDSYSSTAPREQDSGYRRGDESVSF